MFRIHSHPAFGATLFSWSVELDGDGVAHIEASWFAPGRYEGDGTRATVADRSPGWVQWKEALVQLIPPGETRVGHLDDAGGYTINVDEPDLKGKWIETGSIDFGTDDSAHARIDRIVREITKCIEKAVGYEEHLQHQQGRQKKRGPGRYSSS